jgi:hypothetical protein
MDGDTTAIHVAEVDFFAAVLASSHQNSKIGNAMNLRGEEAQH